jgi:wobble nucleotide-excising tRNase
LGEEVSSPDFETISGSEMDFSSPQELIALLNLAVRFLETPEEAEFSIPDELPDHIESTGKLLRQLGKTQQATQDAIDNLNSQYQGARETLEERLQKGLEAEVKRWQKRLQEFDLLNDLEGLEKEVAKLEETANKVSNINKYIRLLLEVRDLLKGVEESLLEEALERISHRVNEIYGRMNPDEALNRIIFRPTGGHNVDLIVDDESLDLSDKEPKPPAFLSEGHLNCLGIAIHLALQGVIDSPFDFVIFDDPLYSIDAGHRRKALDEMFDFANQARKQLFIATHDPLFFHYLKEKLRLRHKDFDSSQVYLVVNHSSMEPDIIKEGSSETFLQAAKERLLEGCDSYAIESVYVLMRREIEYICDRLLQGQRVAVYDREYDDLDSRTIV